MAALQSINPITSLPLGKSVNTSGFLLAVLYKEGVIERLPERAKQYRRKDPQGFEDRLLGQVGQPKAKKKAAKILFQGGHETQRPGTVAMYHHLI